MHCSRKCSKVSPKEGVSLSGAGRKCACRRRVDKMPSSVTRLSCPSLEKSQFSLQTASFEPLLETRWETNHFLLVMRFQNAPRCDLRRRWDAFDCGRFGSL